MFSTLRAVLIMKDSLCILLFQLFLLWSLKKCSIASFYLLWPGSKSLNSDTSKEVTSCRFQRKFTISVSSPALFILVRKELLYLYVFLGCIHFGCTTIFTIYVFSSYSWLQIIIISTPYSCLSQIYFSDTYGNLQYPHLSTPYFFECSLTTAITIWWWKAATIFLSAPWNIFCMLYFLP